MYLGCSGDTGSPSVTQPICGACSTLFSPLNGTVTFSSISLSVGTSATYRCNYGYSLSGSAYRTCLSSCSWSGTQPSCERQGKLTFIAQIVERTPGTIFEKIMTLDFDP